RYGAAAPGWKLGSGRALARVPAVTPRPAGNGSSSWSSGFPCCIGARHANGAGPVPGGDGGLLIGEEDPVSGVPAADDGAQRRRAVEPAIDPALAVPAEPAGNGTAIET